MEWTSFVDDSCRDHPRLTLLLLLLLSSLATRVLVSHSLFFRFIPFLFFFFFFPSSYLFIRSWLNVVKDQDLEILLYFDITVHRAVATALLPGGPFKIIVTFREYPPIDKRLQYNIVYEIVILEFPIKVLRM